MNHNTDRALKKTAFTRFVIRENGLDATGFKGWVFWESMLFRSSEKWWGDRGKRKNPHEGLDFLLYQDRLGGVVRLERETRIPVMYDGVVTAIVSDYLGKSVIVAHNLPDCHRPLLSVYGHTLPGDDIRTGKELNEGNIIGTLAGPGKAEIRPHLHISLGWVSHIDAARSLDWDKMNDQGIISMIDPLAVIDGHYRVLTAERTEEGATNCAN